MFSVCLQGEENLLARLIYTSQPISPDNIRRLSVLNQSNYLSPQYIPQIKIVDVDEAESDCTSSQELASQVYAPNGFIAFRNLLRRCKRRFITRVTLGLLIT